MHVVACTSGVVRGGICREIFDSGGNCEKKFASAEGEINVLSLPTTIEICRTTLESVKRKERKLMLQSGEYVFLTALYVVVLTGSLIFVGNWVPLI